MKTYTKFIATLLLSVIYNFSFSQNCSNLFISEYVEGTANNKAIEIYNPTDDIIDLGRYYVARFSNGGSNYESGGITQLQGFIGAHSTHVLVNGQTTSTATSPACSPELQALASQLDHDYPSPTYMNGNDAIALYYDSKGNGNSADFIPVDLFGIIGGGMSADDEGWTSFTDSMIIRNIYEGDVVVDKDTGYVTNYIVPEGFYWLPWSSNHSLVRKPTVLKGVTENPSVAFIVTQEWDTLAGGANVWDSLGSHTCNCKTTGLLQKTQKEAISLYPNPVTEILTIHTDQSLNGVSIYSRDGKLLFKQNANLQNKKDFHLDLSQYASGIYFISIATEDGITTEKIIVE